jgi:hypothetical protein
MIRAAEWVGVLAVGYALGTGLYQMDVRAAETIPQAADSQPSGQYLTEKKEAFQAWVSDRLTDLDKRQAQLKAKAEAMGDQAKADWRELDRNLGEQRDKIQVNLNEAKRDTAERWDQVKQQTEEAMRSLQYRYEQMVAKLKKDS